MKPLLFLFSFLLFASAESNTTDSNLTEESISADVETQDSYLSDVEYGKMLYRNPRGISCIKCHGEGGKGGQHIVTYYDKRKNPKILRGVDIRPFNLNELTASLSDRYRENNRTKRHKIMPIYYLTEEEIHALYSYLQSNREEE